MKYFEEEKFTEIDLNIIEGAEFMDCSFEGIDFTNTNFKNTKILGCRFLHCNLSGIVTLNSSWSDTRFQDCKGLGINWSDSQRLNQLQFFDSLLRYSVFQEIECVSISFKNCDLTESDFSQAKIKECLFEGSNLSGVSFTGADLRKGDFRGALNYSIDPQWTKVKGAKFSLPEALSFLQSLEIFVE